MWRRYACIRQTGQSDCGAAALATVALHYRRPIALQQLRDLAGTDRIGTNLRGLLQAAETLGFAAKGVKGTYEALPQVPLPTIAHVKTEEGLGHFLVLYRIKKDALVVADPARGIQKLSRDEFCRRWTGYLLLLVPEQQATCYATGSWLTKMFGAQAVSFGVIPRAFSNRKGARPHVLGGVLYTRHSGRKYFFGAASHFAPLQASIEVHTVRGRLARPLGQVLVPRGTQTAKGRKTQW
jgi:hypothetical protein